MNTAAKNNGRLELECAGKFIAMRAPGYCGKASMAIILLFCMSPGREQAIAQGSAASPTGLPAVIRKFPLTRFYDTGDPLPRGQPGELIRSAKFTEYQLPLTVSAVRLIYHSRSADGDDVAASAVVLFPDGEAPAGGWPVIAWAHELNGVARHCAPSLSQTLSHGPFLSMYVQLGYAIVATDYTGLGTRFRNAFADLSANALDVVYSVSAARQALPGLDRRWVAMGTGEGAMAAIAVAELEQPIQQPNYLGSITLSPLADFEDLLDSPSALSYKWPLLFAYGIKTVFPQFQLNSLLSDKGLLLYPEIENTCSEPGALRESSAMGIVRPNWKTANLVQKYLSRNHVGLKPASAPLLVLGSGVDASVAETAKVVRRLCKKGDRVQFHTYPESDPGRVIGDSVRDQITWIQARFRTSSAPTNCSQMLGMP
ncbi:MAG: hypothetical protein JOZ14_20000 [Acidobacteria bacterium]|nr:hypothetical protein [Acidobacteriota bacterium]